MTKLKFDEKWLREAVEIEDETGCDIHAGLELGHNLGEYVTTVRSYIDRQKLISVLKEGLDDILSQRDIEEMADKLQQVAQETVKEKIKAKKTA